MRFPGSFDPQSTVSKGNYRIMSYTFIKYVKMPQQFLVSDKPILLKPSTTTIILFGGGRVLGEVTNMLFR